MKDAASIRYQIHKLKTSLKPDLEKLQKLESDLPVAVRRELKQLAKVLKYKADVYGPDGRIFSCDGEWSVINNCLVFTDRETKTQTTYNPEHLTDGHGQIIDGDSKL